MSRADVALTRAEVALARRSVRKHVLKGGGPLRRRHGAADPLHSALAKSMSRRAATRALANGTRRPFALATRPRLWRSFRSTTKAGLERRTVTSPFSRLCRAEAMRTLFLELAGRRSVLPPQERTRLRLEARLAAVRAEMYGDLCSMKAGPGAEGWDRGPGSRAGAAAGAGAVEAPRRWRGVNVSSWLLWEPGPADKSWLVASLGPGERPEDEWGLCERLVEKHGREAAERMVQRYRSERVTRADFAAMKKLGLNAVRVPFGYWALRPRPGEPFFGGCAEFLDDALAWGEELGLSVVLCLHAAVGFQSQDPPCGRANRAWRPCRFDVDATVDVMRDVALRFGGHPALGGICVLNEPSGDIPPRTMNRYFQEVYSALRTDCRLPASVQIMLPVFHHDFRHFRGRYTEDQGYVNVLFDVHVYQVFGEPYAGWHRMSLAQNLRHADALSSTHDVRAIADCGERVVVTEFSLALPKWRTKTTTYLEYAGRCRRRRGPCSCAASRRGSSARSRGTRRAASSGRGRTTPARSGACWRAAPAAGCRRGPRAARAAPRRWPTPPHRSPARRPRTASGRLCAWTRARTSSVPTWTPRAEGSRVVAAAPWLPRARLHDMLSVCPPFLNFSIAAEQEGGTWSFMAFLSAVFFWPGLVQTEGMTNAPMPPPTHACQSCQPCKIDRGLVYNWDAFRYLWRR
ncbi:unnamed protein product [Prorocentrum cordatum]|uniref:Glycoside hydrolase family 5 domain-containing protein n=1 Tax=Prorocentrum cordatum TaxID=2364126 RepID=A0ABN9SM81_9DINO|nr:unnamed protein product [Polarella glacialis]